MWKTFPVFKLLAVENRKKHLFSVDNSVDNVENFRLQTNYFSNYVKRAYRHTDKRSVGCALCKMAAPFWNLGC